MAKTFEENALSIGVHINKEPEVVYKYGGCTDMGNVSDVVPSIHPKFYIGTTICNHNEGFTTASGTLCNNRNIQWYLTLLKPITKLMLLKTIILYLK